MALPRSMVRKNRSSDQSLEQVAGKSFVSKGATTTMDDVVGSEIDPRGGSFRSTLLAKREC